MNNLVLVINLDGNLIDCFVLLCMCDVLTGCVFGPSRARNCKLSWLFCSTDSCYTQHLSQGVVYCTDYDVKAPEANL